MRLNGKRVLITGGTGGMGRDVVKRFVAEGAKVVFCGRNADAGRGLEEETGGHASFVRADVTVEADVAALVEAAVATLGGIDCLFNNAAEARNSAFLDTSPGDLQAAMWSVFGSVAVVTQHVARHMVEQRSGVIIQNGSSAAHRANSSPAIYSALKAAVCHLTRCLALEFAPFGIRVNTISPGSIMTPIFKTLFQMGDMDDAEALRRIGDVIAGLSPAARAGTGDDVAAAAVFLASDEASYITGHDLKVDGGLTAGLTPHMRKAQFDFIRNTLEDFAKQERAGAL
ncbi:MAG: SDR family oxidoreductase [Lysobacter sp.]|nr:SDR family oxidoreductase [Lysobacter sp.]